MLSSLLSAGLKTCAFPLALASDVVSFNNGRSTSKLVDSIVDDLDDMFD